jgi:hypothetical protein
MPCRGAPLPFHLPHRNAHRPGQSRLGTATRASRLKILDEYLLRPCPPLRIFGGNVVLTCHHR